MKDLSEISACRQETANNYAYLPSVDCADEQMPYDEVRGDSPCPCCGYMTIPNKGDALAYICPVCMWEIDLFISSEDEPSDLNHGLTLIQARDNYNYYGAVLPHLKQYCRQPYQHELPRHEHGKNDIDK